MELSATVLLMRLLVVRLSSAAYRGLGGAADLMLVR
jgi:hypothetical protein